MWKKTDITILILVLVAVSQSIYIPLSGRIPRCMIVYSVGQAETVKLDISFPPFPQQQIHEHYEVSWKNTQNNEMRSQTIKNGKFRRQLSLTQNVIYDLCIKAESSRDYGVIHVEYNANNLFSINQAEVKVPENLVKQNDVKETYVNADKIEQNLDSFIKAQENKTATHSQIFRKTKKISERLVQISVAQLIIIIGAGCFQFYIIWNYLKGKHYL